MWNMHCHLLSKLLNWLRLNDSPLLTFICIISVGISSCVPDLDESNSSGLDLIDSIEFETNMSIEERFSGNFENDSNKKIYYFGNTATNASIKFFDEMGNFIFSTNLKEALEQGSNIYSLDVIDIDSIIILGAHNNTLFVMNNQGRVVTKKVVLDSERDQTRFLLNGSLMGDFVRGSSIICKAIWLPLNKNENSSYKDLIMNIAEMELTNSTIYKLDYLDNNLSMNVLDSINLYEKLEVNEGQYFRESTIYNVTDEHLIWYSEFSDLVFTVNISDFTNYSQFEIKSDFTDIGTKPPKINDEFVNNKNAIGGGNLGGKILKVVYNKIVDKYFVLVLHQVEDVHDMQASRPFSILEFDDQFRKISETKFDEKLYDYFLMSVNNGILIQRKTKFETYNEQTLKFHYFE